MADLSVIPNPAPLGTHYVVVLDHDELEMLDIVLSAALDFPREFGLLRGQDTKAVGLHTLKELTGDGLQQGAVAKKLREIRQ